MNEETKKNESRKMKQEKESAFNWLVGILHQNRDKDKIIIPHAKFFLDYEHQIPSYVDFFRYDPEKRNGDMIEVDWGGNPGNLTSRLSELDLAGRHPMNAGRDMGEHINIKITGCAKGINVVAHEKNPEYSHIDLRFYETLEDLVGESKELEPLRQIENYLSQKLDEDRLGQVENMKDFLYRVFMRDHIEGKITNLKDLRNYVKKYLAKGKIMPDSKLDKIYDPAHEQNGFGTAHRLDEDGNSEIVYIKR
jgi:hypothetical protein